MYPGQASGGGPSDFVRTLADLASRGISPAVADDQYGRLTFTTDVARTIRHLVETSAFLRHLQHHLLRTSTQLGRHRPGRLRRRPRRRRHRPHDHRGIVHRKTRHTPPDPLHPGPDQDRSRRLHPTRRGRSLRAYLASAVPADNYLGCLVGCAKLRLPHHFRCLRLVRGLAGACPGNPARSSSTPNKRSRRLQQVVAQRHEEPRICQAKRVNMLAISRSPQPCLWRSSKIVAAIGSKTGSDPAASAAASTRPASLRRMSMLPFTCP